MQKTLLTILDGWGIGTIPEVDAIKNAKTPFFDHLMKTEHNATLVTFGNDVGLPFGQMGNSEVGHMNIGAGRIVYQDLMKINNSIKSSEFCDNKVLQEAIKSGSKKEVIHIMGLLSDGGVHSHLNHLYALIECCQKESIPRIVLHIYLDGRDTSPQSGLQYLQELISYIDGTNAYISTVVGRYYAMDRDHRWERTSVAYKLLTKGEGEYSNNILKTVSERYKAGETDEFMRPITMADSKYDLISSNDTVIFFNYRSDRPRQLVRVLTQENFPDFGMEKLDLDFYTMTGYDDSWKGIKVFFHKEHLKDTLGEVIAQRQLSQLRIAETEKYPHVTFFFSGGEEDKMSHEKRIVVPSPKVATYDLKPEMSALSVTDHCLHEIESEEPDFICLNYANTDMVGHTGVWDAAIKAAETVDTQLQRLVECAVEHDYCVIIIADHGNSDIMQFPDGSPHTAHTMNLVPIIILNSNKEIKQLSDGKLADIAPTILKIMDIPIPNTMNGNILIS